jgi:hypothetical protein
MAKRKPIKMHKGDVKKLAILCGVSTKTVYNALHWRADTESENEVRRQALTYFDYKKF